MRQEVQVYVTIKLKGLNQRFEESDEGDRQMGFLVIVVITIKYLQLIYIGGVRVNDSITVLSMWELTPVGTRFS